MSFVDLPFQEHRMMEMHYMDQNPCISSICPNQCIITDNMTWGDDVAQSPSPTEPKWGYPAPPPWPAIQVLASFQFLLCQCVKDGRCTRYPMPKVGGGWVGWLAGHMYGWLARVWWVTASNQWWSSLTPPINNLHTPFGEIEIKNWGLASYSAPKFIICRVERVVRLWGLEDFSSCQETSV
jgi:hypothetical protein